MNKKVEILSGVTALHSSLTSNQPAGGGSEPGVGVLGCRVGEAGVRAVPGLRVAGCGGQRSGM